jgi:myo-inositol-1(or 4)-monophosphatase
MYEKELSVALKSAKEAGAIIMKHFGRVNNISKKGEINLVTQADIESEDVIIKHIRSSFPDDGILAEENGEICSHSNRRWLIDPLDGTTNFAHGFPIFAVSIALEVENEIVLAVVYNPYMRELFEAIKSKGAYLNNRPIQTSSTQKMGDALLATGFPYDIHSNPRKVLDIFKHMVMLSQGVRRAGSAAIDLCYLAAGRIDGFWEQDLKPWDTAAGILMVKEAGGILSTYSGDPYDPYCNTIVATNPHLHEPMLKALEPFL